MLGESGNLVYIIFPSDINPAVCIITWEMYGLSHQFPIAQENAKSILWVELGKLELMFFPQYGCFYPIRFPSYGILHHMGKVWVSPSIFHSMEKCSKARPVIS